MAGTRRTKEVVFAADLDPAPILDDIIDLADEVKAPIREISRSRFESMARTDGAQGVIASAAPLRPVELGELLVPEPAGLSLGWQTGSTQQGGAASVDLQDGAAKPPADLQSDSPASAVARPGTATPDQAVAGDPAPAGTAPFLLLIDSITDPRNLGAILRTAECAGVSGVILPRHRAARITPAVTKAAAGAVEHLRMATVGGLPAAMNRLRAAGIWIVGLDSTGNRSLFDLEMASEPLALALGAEGAGLSRLVRHRCDVVASIPLSGVLASLNVANAAAVACFEVARRRV